MTLVNGTRLGPYEILSPLGAGGMGEVYRARDSRLHREVAIKVLPAAVASDTERLKRFEKEARSASALSHPNIVTVYDIGSSEGVSWIALELVSGETLRSLLVNGALPIKKLLSVAAQVAEGLAKAHEAGIVHRDLKPENVMVTKDGIVKILDFGLAKLTMRDSDEGSQLPTETGTSPGLLLGTVGYMSPEQASGETLDFRSDQFSFGSIVYEMATGKRPFQKKTPIETLTAILNEEPEPIAKLAPRTPAPLRWIAERCLTKEPEGRYASTKDLARELAGLRDHLSEASSAGLALDADGAQRRRVSVPLIGAVALAAAFTLAGLVGRSWLASRDAKMSVPTLHRLTSRRGSVTDARYAPDGKTVVYTAAWDGKPPELFTVRTDAPESRQIGIPMARVLSVSSKREVAILMVKDRGFGYPGTLARIPIGGGTPREILEDVWNADWAPNGEDLAVVRRGPSGEALLQYPIGTTLAEFTGDYVFRCAVSPSGELVAFMQGDSLITVDRRGTKHVVSKGWNLVEPLDWCWSGENELILEGSRRTEAPALYAITLKGKERVLVNLANAYGLQDVAADGRMLVEYSNRVSGMAFHRPGDKLERYYEGQDSSLSGMSEDGQYLFFYDPLEPGQIFLRKTDGSLPVRLGHGFAVDISSDGRWVLVIAGPRELDLVPTGPGIVKKVLVENVDFDQAGFLPGGKGFVLFVTREKGVDLFVVGPDGGKASPVRLEGSVGRTLSSSVLSADGSRILWNTADGQLRIGSLTDGKSTVVPGPPLVIGRDWIKQWSADDRFLYVEIQGRNGTPAQVDLLDLATGQRKLWKKLMPADPTGVLAVGGVGVSRDGQSYIYSYTRTLADLYLVSGLK